MEEEAPKMDDNPAPAAPACPGGTQFDVLDCVEEPFDDDDEDDEEDDFFSSEESGAASFKEEEEEEGDSSSDEVDESLADKSSSDAEMEQVYEPGPGVDAPADCDECWVAERPNFANNPLPAGWKEIYHESGATIFVYPETNVCSLSRPYFLGKGSTKSHVLPETAIPCLSYRKIEANEEPQPPPPPPEMAASERAAKRATTPGVAGSGGEAKVINYCRRLFKVRKLRYLKFRSWDVRRTYLRTLRNERNRRKCPFSNNKLITFPIVTKDDEGNVVATRKCIINPRGKSYVAILHEYMQQALKTQPMYTFDEVDNARTPYAASVVVNGDEYGSGVGMSKKEAKVEAAKAALLVLLPKMKKYISNVDDRGGAVSGGGADGAIAGGGASGGPASRKEDADANVEQNIASVFNDIEICDPRITQLSMETTEPKPYELLLKCLQKKGDQQEVKFDFQLESEECTMSVGEHTVTIRCANKRDGKQQAAQALLQQLHPYINNWGSLLRLYSNHTADQYQLGSRQANVDKGVEEIRSRTPNQKLLDSLREHMLRLRESVD